MSEITCELFEDRTVQGKTGILISEIVNIYKGYTYPGSATITLNLYLLYCASKFNDPLSISYQDILDGAFELDEVQLQMVKQYIPAEVWESVLKQVNRFSQKELALAVIRSDFETMAHRRDPFTPQSVSELVAELLQIQANDRIADFCCGCGNFLIHTALYHPEASYFGCELSPEKSAILKAKMKLIETDMQVEQKSIDELSMSEERYDKIFSNFLEWFRTRETATEMERQISPRLEAYKRFWGMLVSDSWIYNKLICEKLSPNGKAAAIMKNRSLWGGEDLSVRKQFVENGMIESVITLPIYLFPYTSIPMSLVIFSNNNNGVRMVDATTILQIGRHQKKINKETIEKIVAASKYDTEYSRMVTLDELRENAYELHISRYQEHISEVVGGVEFEQIIKNVTRGTSFNQRTLDELESKEPTNIQYLNISNIQDGMIVEKLPYLKELDKKQEKYCLKENNLIISRNGNPFKIAVAENVDNKKILATANLFIIELNTDQADPYYIKAFLESPQGKIALRNCTVGEIAPFISVDKLKKLKLPLPNMPKQKRIAKKVKIITAEMKELKMRLKAAKNRLEHVLEE